MDCAAGARAVRSWAASRHQGRVTGSCGPGRTAPWPCQRQAWGGHNQRLPKILPDPSRAECGQSVRAELCPSPGRRPQLAPRRPAPSPGPVAGAGSRSGLLRAWRHAGSPRHRVRVSLTGAGRTAVAPRWAGCVCARALRGSPLGRPGANSPNLLPTGVHSTPGRRLALAKGSVEGLPDAAEPFHVAAPLPCLLWKDLPSSPRSLAPEALRTAPPEAPPQPRCPRDSAHGPARRPRCAGKRCRWRRTPASTAALRWVVGTYPTS